MLSSTKAQLKKEHARGAKRTPGDWLVLLGQVLVWQLVAILFVEMTLFFAGLGEEEIFKLDPDLGVTHICNKKITWRSEGFATSFLNEDGMREPGLKVAKEPGTFRVALLGDSLTESLQVPVEQSFAVQVQEKLKAELHRPVQVLNFGTSGYSTVQEYLQIKKKVLKYKPDLVMLCYNSRDCFENWSPPDEVLTNVRPAAIHLPGGKLTIDHTPVQQWMRTPRARFLKHFEFLREQSRIWGLYAQAELDWSLHNETYKRIVFFLTRPGKAIRQFWNEFSDWCKVQIAAKPKIEPVVVAKALPEVSAKPAEPAKVTKPGKVVSTAIGASVKPAAPVSKVQPNSAEKPKSNIPEAPKITANSSPSDLRKNYEYLIMRTLGSLLLAMKNDSAASGARFAIVALPVRSDLAGNQGMPSAFTDYTYNDELKMLQGICQDYQIPLFNLHEQAKPLKAEERDALFYLVHYTPKGHEFVAGKLMPPLRDCLKGAQAQ